MALLYVVGHGDATLAAAGNRDTAQVTLSVTDRTGAPVNGLVAANVRVGVTIVAAGGSHLEMTSLGGGPIQIGPGPPGDGIYLLALLPVQNYDWRPGTYTVVAIVTRGHDHGQTLVPLGIP